MPDAHRDMVVHQAPEDPPKDLDWSQFLAAPGPLHSTNKIRQFFPVLPQVVTKWLSHGFHDSRDGLELDYIIGITKGLLIDFDNAFPAAAYLIGYNIEQETRDVA